MEIFVTYDGPGEDGSLRFGLPNGRGEWLDVYFDAGPKLTVGYQYKLVIATCKHHGDLLCRCPVESREGGIELLYV